MKRKAMIVLLAISPIFLLGATCQQKPVDSIGQVIMSMGVLYNSTMETLSSLYKQKLITDQDVAKIVDVGNKFRVAYNTAMDIYIVWLRTQSSDDEQRLFVAINNASILLNDLQSIASQFIPKEGSK